MDLSANKYKLPELHIGNKTARIPIIQGGMGVGVSLSGLAGAVAKEGGVGIISTAQIGYDDDAFDEDRDTLLGEIFSSGICCITDVGASVKSSKSAVALSKKWPQIYAAVGVHPDSTADMTEEDIETLRSLAQEKKVVAIGEIGLDYYWDNSPREVQKKWFERQLALAREVDLPVIIHSREAAKDTMDIMREAAKAGNTGVIHCYSYAAPMAKEYISMGFFIGIGGVVTFKNARVIKEVVSEIPLSSIVLETDSPYLAPVPYRGKRNNSMYLKEVVKQLAQIKQVSEETVITTTLANAKRLYRLEENCG